MSLLANSNAIESGGYNIDRSLRFRSSASAYLNRTPASAGNRRTWTWSGWVKRGTLANRQWIFSGGADGATEAGLFDLEFTSSDNLRVAGGLTQFLLSSAVYRDASAWYHIILCFDTSNATAADRVIVYVNGSRISTSAYSAPSLNFDGAVNNTVVHYTGRNGPSASFFLDGYLAEVNFIDGQVLTPSSFGEYDAITGVWKPKKYTGTYGTNGFYLDFKDNTSATTLAYDKSGNGNNWTANNISTTAGATYDSMTDVPTLTSATAANFATINPVMTPQFAQTYYDGNLRCVGGYAYVNAQSTIAVHSGKWYAEAVFTAKASAELAVGIFNKDIANFIGNSGENGSCGYWTTGQKSINGTRTSYAATYTTNDIIGVAMDIDGSTVTFYKNGVSQGAISYTFSGNYGFLTSGGGAFASGDTVIWNFGQRSFSYTPPTGFKALNTFNLPDPTIKKPNQYMDIGLWTGDGSATRTITTSQNFTPDLYWIKNRTSGFSNLLYDTIRGAGENADLSSNTTAAEGGNNTNATYGYVSAFTSNGLSVVKGTDANGYTNGSGNAYVGWQWKKGATPGFDIVTFTSPASGNFTVNHSLGVTPAMVIVKTRDTAGWNWHVWHKSLASATNSVLILNSTSAVNSSFNMWGAAGATSTTIGITTGNSVPANSACVAYLFSEIPGFSKFGSYTGNGSADGPFVYCGFRPKYVMAKRSDSADGWYVLDAARNTYNALNAVLAPNDSAAEFATADRMDFTSNGFKLRVSVGPNQSGGTYIYAAFAENPFKYSNAR